MFFKWDTHFFKEDILSKPGAKIYGFTSPPIFSILLNNSPSEVEAGEDVEHHVT